jgi:hypothetical protein
VVKYGLLWFLAGIPHLALLFERAPPDSGRSRPAVARAPLADAITDAGSPKQTGGFRRSATDGI